MSKLKTHKGLKKRIKVTATGKVLRSKAGKSHLMSGKPGRKRQSLRKKTEASPAFSKNMKEALHYIKYSK
ncbi:MAG: 50S ribosomal protein L35 [Candidatus Loosdrechtia sp.]|uniref:large ribosomal subunit protein bL35 n=1 Tax=Candidatus Loosdrechtia sp. TaxID=3101272 RepID=UPI003A72FDAA|nr:MAG: 50S ribosomal protein L35 [Candidatus Jettenia sp. AMX2]